MFRYVWCLVAALALVAPTFAQVSLTNASPTYTQNFDSLANAGTTNVWSDNTTIAGWYARRTSGAATVYIGSDGSSNTGGIHSFGTAATTERAMGSIGSGTPSHQAWGVRIKNNGSTDITSLGISLNGEQWRDGGAATPVAQSISCGYLISGTAITSLPTPAASGVPATYTAASGLDVTSPVFVNTATGAAVNGNVAGRVARSTTITLTLSPGSEIMLLWNDPNDTGNDHGLGIDDFALTATFAAPSGNDYAVGPTSLSVINFDDADGSINASAVITATNNSTITGVNLVGSTDWTYTGTATPFVVNAGTTAALTFTYNPDANTAVADITTATVTSSNLPASVAIALSGNTVKEVPLAQFKSEAEAGTAGTTVYKVTNAIVNSNGVQGTRNQVPVQDEATGSASTRGVWIDDASSVGKGAGSLPAAGSTLTVWGTYTNNRGLVQFVPTKAYQVTATGATVVPYSTAGSGIGDSTEGVLITVPDTVVPVGSYDSTVASVNVTVSDGTSYVARLLNSAAIVYTGTGLPYPLTGVAGQFTSTAVHPNTGGDGYQVFPRSSADVPVELSSFDAE